MKDAWLLSPRLYDALEYAFKLHGRDARKETNTPQMAHLLQVCALVQADGGDEDEAIAALLHDSLEDKGDLTSRAEIRSRYGPRVEAMVVSATDTPPDFSGGEKPPWRQRKEYYLSHLRETDPSLLRVTVADKVENVQAILRDYRRIGDSLWGRFRAGKEDQLWYYRSAVEAYRAAGVRSPLLDDLDELVSELERAARSRDDSLP